MTDLPPSLQVVPNIPRKDQTLEQLIAERDYWLNKITSATSWGGALAACDEFLKDCEREIARRNRT